MSRAGAPRLRRALRYVALGFVGLLLVLCAGLAWVLASESGTRTALSLVEDIVTVDGLSGRLAGPLDVAEVRVSTANVRLHIHNLHFDWRPNALFKRKVDGVVLTADLITVASRPAEEETPSEPLTLPEIPLPVTVTGTLRADSMVVLPWDETDERAPLGFSDFEARLSGESRVQRIDALSLTTPWGAVQLAALVDTRSSPHPVTASGWMQTQQQGHDIALAYDVGGTLARLEVDLDAEGAGVTGEVDGVLAPFEKMPLVTLSARLNEFDPAVFVGGAPAAELSFAADLAGDVESGRLGGTLNLRNARPGTLDAGLLPFESLAAQLDASLDSADLAKFEINLPGGGSLVGNGRADYAAETEVMHFDLTGRLAGLNPAKVHGEAPEGSIALDLTLVGDANGALAAEWSFGESRLFDLALKGAGQVAVEGKRLPAVEVDLALGSNHVRAQGAWGDLEDVLDFDVNVSGLKRFAPNLGGRVQLKGQLAGGLEAPHGSVQATANQLVAPGVFMRDLKLDAELGTGEGALMALDLNFSGLGADAETLWVTRGDARVTGTVDQHELRVDLDTEPVGAVALRMDGGLVQDENTEEGTAESQAQTGQAEAGEAEIGAVAGSQESDGQENDGREAGEQQVEREASPLRWEGRIASVRVAEGPAPLHLVSPASLVLSAEKVELGEARFDAGERGHIHLTQTMWSPESMALHGSLSGMQIVEAGNEPYDDPLTFGGEWGLELAQSLNGQLRLFRESGDFVIPGEFSRVPLGLEQFELEAFARDGRVDATLQAQGAELGDIDGKASARVEKHAEAGWRFVPGAALDGGVDLDMPSIEWLGRLLQEGAELGGALSAQVELGGTPEAPDFSGRIEGHELAAALVDEGVSLTGGELLATFDRDWLRLERLEFITPNRVRPDNNTMRIDDLIATPGRFIATGEIDLASGEGLLGFEADRLPVLQRPDRWLLLSGEGEATTTWSGLELEAEFRADAGYIEFAETAPPSLSSDVVILTGEEEDDEVQEEGGFDVNADIKVRMGEALNLSALGLTTRLAGELSLHMRPGQAMSATGSITTVGGVYKGYGQDLEIDRGAINFQGELSNPGLNIVALRKGLAVEAGVSVTGTARRPVIRLVSQPDVPDAAKLSWIMLGRAPSGEGGGDLAMLLPAAQAMLGGNMTDSLSKSLGVDEFSIGQASGGSMASSQVVDGGRVGGSSGIGGQVVTIGKRLSPDLFLAFEQGLGGADSLVKMTYQLTRRISLVASGGGDDSAGDAYYTITFR